MISLAREIKIVITLVIAGALGLVALIQYTDVCSLQAVTLNGKLVSDWHRELGLATGRSLLKQPLDSLADALMTRQGITRVNIKYRLPNTVQIETNNLLPVCFLLDRGSGLLYGVDESGRVVPLPADYSDWEHPIITGTGVRRLNEFCTDIRVPLLIAQLEEIRTTHPSLYLLMQEIDLSNPNFATVAISGLGYTLKISSEKFAERIDAFESFLENLKPRTDSVQAFDLRYEDMIIQVRQTNRPKRERADSSAVGAIGGGPSVSVQTLHNPGDEIAQKIAGISSTSALKETSEKKLSRSAHPGKVNQAVNKPAQTSSKPRPAIRKQGT